MTSNSRDYKNNFSKKPYKLDRKQLKTPRNME